MPTRFLTAPLGLCLASGMPAADFFVSPSGDDLGGDGSAAKPWRSLAHAAGNTPGASANTIRMAAGTYRETASSWVKPNVSVIGAGPSLTTVENAFVSGFDFLLRLDTALDGLPDGALLAGNQTISGFHIVGVDHANRTRQSGIRIRGRHNVTIENMKFSYMGNGGIDIRAMDVVNPATGPIDHLEGMVVRACVFENTAKDQYANVLIGGTEGAELSDLSITESRGVGIKAWAGGWLKALRIRRCTINMLPPDRDRNQTAGDDWPSIELTQVSDGSDITECFLNHWVSLSTSAAGGGPWNLGIRNNHFVYEAGTFQPIQIGNHGTPNLEVSGNFFQDVGPEYAVANWPFFGAIANVSVHRNVFQGDGVNSRGILFQPNDPDPRFSNNGGNIPGIRVFNNTFVGMSDAVLIQPLKGHSAPAVLIQNNLIADFSALVEARALIAFHTAEGTAPGATVSHNLFHNIPENRSVAGVAAASSIFDDPELLRSGQIPAPYYELASSSPARNAGAAVAGFSVADGQTDLGAYEFGAATGGADSDGDGQSDAAELTAGTSPSNPNDVLRIVGIQIIGSQVSLTWSSVAGKTYAIESTAPGFAAWTERSRAQATGSQTTGSATIPGGPMSAFIRVRVL